MPTGSDADVFAYQIERGLCPDFCISNDGGKLEGKPAFNTR
ncbi:MAG: hypothetical protein ACUVUH_05475 [bacterium]